MNNGNHQHTVEARADDVARALKNSRALCSLQRQDVRQALSNPVAVTKEIIHREDNEKDLHYRPDQSADEAERASGNRPAHSFKTLDDGFLREHLIDVNVLS